MNRRGFLTGLVSALAAPAIVRASSLMPVRVMPDTDWLDAAYAMTRDQMTKNLYGDLIDTTRKAIVPRLFVQLRTAPLWVPRQW